MVTPILAAVVAGFLAAPTPVASPQEGPQRPAARGSPHLLFVMVDDLGWQDTSVPLADAPTAFNARYRTPNFERLAARGVSFTQAYAAAPVCTPTRTSLMTGRSPAATHITYWILHAGKDTSADFAGLRPPAWDLDGLQPGDVTLPALLSAAGYRTIHVGKAHLGGEGSPGGDPTTLGFDVNIAGHGAGAPASYHGTDGFSRGSVWDVPGLERWHGQDVFLTEALAAEAVDAVAAAVADEQPFFLHFAPYAVHTPIQANARYLEHYPDLHPTEAAYATMVESVDTAVGDLLDLLEELGVADDTFIVLTSDNGGLSAHGRGGAANTHNLPLRSGKGSAFEGGTRVVAFAAGAGVGAEPGSRCDVPIITHDWFTTLLARAGVAVPADHAETLEGIDLAPLLRGEDPSPALSERTLGWHQPHFWGVNGPGIWPYSALRRGDHKLIHRHGDGALLLFDLSTDLGETTDLADRHPDLVAELAGQLTDWLEGVAAQPSLDAETGEPVPSARARAAALR